MAKARKDERGRALRKERYRERQISVICTPTQTRWEGVSLYTRMI